MKILIVDSDPETTAVVALTLGHNRHETTAVHSGTDALALLERTRVDLVILDVLLPGIDGFEVCRRLRQRDVGTPILILSARSGEADRVLGLDLGADDYMTKPFSPRELLARVAAIGRRASPAPSEGADRGVGGGRLSIDPCTRELLVDGRPMHLTLLEYEIVRCLTQHAGRVVTYHSLLSLVWGPAYRGETNLLRVHVHNLRRKLERDPDHPEHVVTVRGIGYKLNP